MSSQTSLVAEQVRLRQWAAQIQECQSRPADMKVETWCSEHGITKANYYYRLRRIRKACLEACNPEPAFVELPVPAAETGESVRGCAGQTGSRSPSENTGEAEIIRLLPGETEDTKAKKVLSARVKSLKTAGEQQCSRRRACVSKAGRSG